MQRQVIVCNCERGSVNEDAEGRQVRGELFTWGPDGKRRKQRGEEWVQKN